MLALEQGANAIGHGRLETRVNVSTRSAIRGVADTFNSMAQRVQELLRAQKETTDAVSHELRTPISRMRFGVEMLERTTHRCEIASAICKRCAARWTSWRRWSTSLSPIRD